MENDRMRMIEIHIKARSKVNVDSPAGRDRFLYMLSDGALVLAPPGKTPYEFALHAGETAVFPRYRRPWRTTRTRRCAP
jgi:hypothetical protein